MKIYIASSWRNQHGVEMLTALLREHGHEVISWVENNYGEAHNHVTKRFSFEEWVNTPAAEQSFEFDTNGAATADLVIYYGPAGKDACVELGIAYAQGRPVVGLYAKGEDLGLMRKTVSTWYDRYTDLLADLKTFIPNPHACFGREPHRMDFDTKEEFMERHSRWNKHMQSLKAQSS